MSVITNADMVDALFKHEKKGKKHPLIMKMIEDEEWVEISGLKKAEQESLIQEVKDKFGGKCYISYMDKGGFKVSKEDRY